MWCIPEVTPEFVERMEDVLALYEKPYNPKEPVICMDEKSKQLLANKRKSKPAKAGKPRKTDYEYKRSGTRNIFLAVEPKAGFRKVKVTQHRKKPDFTRFIKELTAIDRYRETEKIHVVVDNLNTHFEKSFYETFSQTEADRIVNNPVSPCGDITGRQSCLVGL
ncbi:MAG: transposase [Candidatus Magasanikbacteria bacterium]|nr:transposase [Candidatus Magasanikbacteria bacterium]